MRFLICPVCGASLARVGDTLKCVRMHSFDIAREGYVNLLLSSGKRPKIMGDTREMLRARRNFLERGFYDPLSDAINESVHNRLVDGASPACIADVGCGEGYYLGRLKRYLDSQSGLGGVCYFGLDISKEAARLAAKRYQDIRFVVASVNRKLLFPDGSTRVLTNIFAPRNVAEFDRVLAQNGALLIVIPNPGHLASLRSELNLLNIEPDKRNKVVEQFTGPFRLAGEHTVEYEMGLEGEALSSLVQMTPNYWHISDEAWDDVKAVERIQTEASFTILEFSR
ncbi:MAG: methyltransferase domain-containing protein [Chloroflexota bacterium]|nr:methyltransferase domain-containing protein [Chloroflexota bacterium]